MGLTDTGPRAADRLAAQPALQPAPPPQRTTTGVVTVAGTAIREGTAHRDVLRREARYRRALAVADVVSAACAVTLGLQILGDDRLKLSILVALPLVVLVGKLVGLYDRDENLLRKTTLDEAPAICQVATLYTLLIWLADSLLIHREGFLGRTQMLALWLLLFLMMLGGRALARRSVRRISPPERCLVVGSAAAAKGIERKFKMSPSIKAVVVGRVPLADHEVNGAAEHGRAVVCATRLSLQHRNGVLNCRDSETNDDSSTDDRRALRVRHGSPPLGSQSKYQGAATGGSSLSQ